MANGTITKYVAKDGTISWRARAEGGIGPDGKRRQVLTTHKSKPAAEKWLRQQQARADQGEWATGGTTTVAEWIEGWLAGPATRGRRPTTLRTYAALLRGHVVPTLGAVRLAKLAPVQLENLLAGLEARLQPGSVSLVYKVLHICLADAERLNLLANNPLRKVKAPSVKAGERRHWAEEDARRFMAAIEGDEDRALWLAMLLAALRIGEALALTWADLDLDKATLAVRRTITVDRDGRQRIGETTKSGKARTVPMAPTLVAALRDQRLRVLNRRAARADVWADQGLVFPNELGGARDTDAARAKLGRLCARAAVPPLTPHGLRHICATLLGQRASATEVRDILGHSSLAITNAYMHADRSRQAEALGSLALALEGR